MAQEARSFLMLGLIAILQGCGSGSDIAAMQQQVAALATQVEDTRKDLDVMRQTNQELGNLVTALQTEVSSLKGEEPPALPEAPATADTASPEAGAAPVPEAEVPPLVAVPEVAALPEAESPALPETETPPVPEVPPAQKEAPPPPKKASTSSPSPSKSVAKVSCTEVWKQLGQGKDAEEIAQALRTTVDAVQACEQGIGRGGR